jgi:nucleoside-diphosphate-sugar epimerase
MRSLVDSDPPTVIVVTGATGFVGLNVLHALVDAGHEVTGLDTNDLPPIAARSLGAGGRGLQTIEHVDIRNAAAVRSVFDRVRPEVVIHAAAITAGPERERTDARRIVDVNVGGTQSVLDACDASGVPRLVYISSGAVYGDLTFVDDEELVETTRVAPTGLYGITKLAGEQLVRRHGELHPLETITTRLSAVFGPWEYDTGVRDFMSPMLQLAAAARRGELSRYVPDAERNWVTAPDAAAAVVALALGPRPGFDCYNVCPAVRFGIAGWIDRLRTAFPDADFEVVADPRDASISYDADPRRRRAPVQAERIQEELGEHWCTETDAALDRYLAWIEQHPGWLEADSSGL